MDLEKYKGYLIDLDGTMYKGKIKIPAAKRFIERLQEKDIPFLFLTNNSTQTPETYHKFELATLAIKRGAKFIGTNPDTNLPNERGLVPGAGSVIALVERATQQVATYVGKPEKIIMEKALKKMNMKADDVIMVGDNYNTDIKAGIASDIDTLLVYTGVSTREDVAKEKIKPTYEINSLDEWQ